jgi:murein DD-endopeptidase MepM/ murein hydrolase activator NlpD
VVFALDRISTAFRSPSTSVAAALVGVAVLSAGAGSPRALPVRPAATGGAASNAPGAIAAALCPPRTLPDGNACVRLPEDAPEVPEAESVANGHHDKRGHWMTYDEIPRRPERPSDYDAYRYPVPCDRNCVVSGFDLDRPDDEQRRGPRLSHVGHGAVDLPRQKGTPIRMLALDHQEGDAEVVYVGPLFGTTIITRHALREGGQLHDYLLLFGHLDAQAPGVRAGMHMTDGDLVGFVGDTASPELAHLHLETRRVRAGVDVMKLAPSALITDAQSVVCDPRNVLPLR